MRVIVIVLLYTFFSSVLGQSINYDNFFLSPRHNSVSTTGKVTFSSVVLDKTEVPTEYRTDSLIVVGRFKVFDRDLGWTFNSSWPATNRFNREVERNLEKFDVRYGRENLIVFCVGLVDEHNYTTGEPDDGSRGKTLGPRRGYDGVHYVHHLWGPNFPVYYAGYRFYQSNRGTEYIVCRRPEQPVIQQVEQRTTSAVAKVPKGIGLYPFIEVTHNEWYTGTSLAVNDQRIGMGYTSTFGTKWFDMDVQFSPMNYRRVSDYFELEDVHQYSASSIKFTGSLKLWLVEVSGSEYFVHDLEHSSWDENTLIGSASLNLWKFRFIGIGQTSFVNYIEEVRQSKGIFNQVRGRVGIAPFNDRNSDLELGWQLTNAKFIDDFWERAYQPRVGGVYLKYDYNANLSGLQVKFWSDFSYEKINEIILEKLTDMVVDPPKDHYSLVVGASLFW